MGWIQGYGVGIKGWGPWVRTMAVDKDQGLRGRGMVWGGTRVMGWSQGYGVRINWWEPWVRTMTGDKGQG